VCDLVSGVANQISNVEYKIICSRLLDSHADIHADVYGVGSGRWEWTATRFDDYTTASDGTLEEFLRQTYKTRENFIYHIVMKFFNKNILPNVFRLNCYKEWTTPQMIIFAEIFRPCFLTMTGSSAQFDVERYENSIKNMKNLAKTEEYLACKSGCYGEATSIFRILNYLVDDTSAPHGERKLVLNRFHEAKNYFVDCLKPKYSLF
jgi:hypothetical protein